MKQFIILIFIAINFIGCSQGEKKKEKTSSEINTDVYQCPMKCNNGQTYDKAGDCPVCGMDLEKVTKT